MPIKIPEEITYFFEITRMADRLYYCIPQKQLQLMVEQRQVEANILEDYPHGVDIKVSPIQFEEFRELYGMIFHIDSGAIWQAFQIIKSQTGKRSKKYFGTGFINSQFLENIAKEIEEEILSQPKSMGYRKGLQLEAIKFQKRSQHRVRLSKQRLDKKLKHRSIEGIDPKKPIIEQHFSKIKMSEGDEPFDFLSRYSLKRKDRR